VVKGLESHLLIEVESDVCGHHSILHLLFPRPHQRQCLTHPFLWPSYLELKCSREELQGFKNVRDDLWPQQLHCHWDAVSHHLDEVQTILGNGTIIRGCTSCLNAACSPLIGQHLPQYCITVCDIKYSENKKLNQTITIFAQFEGQARKQIMKRVRAQGNQ